MAIAIAAISVVLLGGLLYLSSHSSKENNGEYLPTLDDETGIEFEDEDIVDGGYTSGEELPISDDGEYVEFPDEI